MAIASDDAQFGHPGERLVGPGFEFNTVLWFWKLGPTLAKELMITGKIVDAAEIYRRGLISNLVPADRLEAEVEQLAKGVALIPADGIVQGKAAFQLASDVMGMRAGYSYGYIAHTFGTNAQFEPDEHNFFKERRNKGPRAAFHERDARFTGLV